MTCIELQESLAKVEDGSTAEQRAHLRTCPACSALVKDLNLIITAAAGLQEADEPSPRVWNSIEIQLRREGLIRPQRTGPLAHSLLAGWGGRWFVPAMALLLVAAGLFVRDRMKVNNELPQSSSWTTPVATQSDLDDNDLMQEVWDSAPAMRAQYQENLRQVNESIRDAQSLVEESPNDDDARRSLMDAYQQKSMLFELAMDRSLP